MGDANNGTGDATMPANNHDFVAVTVPALVPRLDFNATLQDAVAAHSQFASTAGTAIKMSDTIWLVPQGLALEAFLYSSGPPEVSRYNFNLVKRKWNAVLVRRQSSQPGGGFNPSDTLVLEPLGEVKFATHPTTNCWHEEWACSGVAPTWHA